MGLILEGRSYGACDGDTHDTVEYYPSELLGGCTYTNSIPLLSFIQSIILNQNRTSVKLVTLLTLIEVVHITRQH